MRCEDLGSKKIGRLTALESIGSNKWGRAVWHCKCDCGNESVVTANNLKERLVSSCGFHGV